MNTNFTFNGAVTYKRYGATAGTLCVANGSKRRSVSNRIEYGSNRARMSQALRNAVRNFRQTNAGRDEIPNIIA